MVQAVREKKQLNAEKLRRRDQVIHVFVNLVKVCTLAELLEHVLIIQRLKPNEKVDQRASLDLDFLIGQVFRRLVDRWQVRVLFRELRHANDAAVVMDLNRVKCSLVQQFAGERRLVRRDYLDPFLGELDGLGLLYNVVSSTFPEEQVKLIGLLQARKVLDDHASELLQRVDEGCVHVVLHDVAGEDEEQDVEVAGLVVPKLDQAVVGEQDVVLLELEHSVSIAFEHVDRCLFNIVAPYLDFFSKRLLWRNEKLELLFDLFNRDLAAFKFRL